MKKTAIEKEVFNYKSVNTILNLRYTFSFVMKSFFEKTFVYILFETV